MTNSYLLTVQMITKSLRSMVAILDKTQQWSAQENVAEETILNGRIAPDMFPFTKQIQLISDNAKGISSRLSGIEIPSYEDSEKAIFELIDRLNRTIEFIEAIPEESFEGAEEKKITLASFPGKYLTADDYIAGYGLPNFFFHLVTAYAILRNLGMPLGKTDYINDLNLLDL